MSSGSVARVGDSVKSPIEQLEEIDKLISDGMDKLHQASWALRSLEKRLREQDADPGRDQPGSG
jgi:hypothetical protein